jgi:hypothetical protein
VKLYVNGIEMNLEDSSIIFVLSEEEKNKIANSSGNIISFCDDYIKYHEDLRKG